MKIYWILVWGVLLGLLIPGAILAKEPEKEDIEKYVNLGFISFSPQYKFTEDFRAIIFKVRNNASRSISQIFGWVYRYREGENSKAAEFILVNNPHQGGLMLKRGPHPPTKIKEWRFQMLDPSFRPDEKDKFTLRTHPKSIFYSPVEPPPAPAKKK